MSKLPLTTDSDRSSLTGWPLTNSWGAEDSSSMLPKPKYDSCFMFAHFLNAFFSLILQGNNSKRKLQFPVFNNLLIFGRCLGIKWDWKMQRAKMLVPVFFFCFFFGKENGPCQYSPGRANLPGRRFWINGFCQGIAPFSTRQGRVALKQHTRLLIHKFQALLILALPV